MCEHTRGCEGFRSDTGLGKSKEGKKERREGECGYGKGREPGDISTVVEAKKEGKNTGEQSEGAEEVNAPEFRSEACLMLFYREMQRKRYDGEGKKRERNLDQKGPRLMSAQ